MTSATSEPSLQVSTADLARGPGNQTERSMTVPAPEGLGIEVYAVPEAEPIHLDLRLESVMEGVLATVWATTRVVGECSRCLEPITEDIEADFTELFVYPEHAPGGDDTDDEVRTVRKDRIDLEPGLRDALVLDMPFQPTCTPDCPGLCATCGARLAEDPEHDHDEPVDPRWSALQGLTDALDGDRVGSAESGDATAGPPNP